MSPTVVLDISRLLSRVLHATPTGVDRVEMAYARGLRALYGDRLAFAGVHPTGLYGRFETRRVNAFLDRTERRWLGSDDGDIAALRRSACAALLSLLPKATPSTDEPRAYVQSSPHHLTRPELVAKILAREQARFVPLVHDLIPIEYPEYARPNGATLHRTRIETVTRFASGIIANSAATAGSLKPWITRSGRSPIVSVAWLGTDPIRPLDAYHGDTASGRPYFVCIGTIEPRKNHLLLLHLWRRLAEQHGADAIPRLVLIGRRGWENEQVLDLLDRCPALRGCVEERNGVSDAAMLRTLRGARALLLPSFAEGYGMPVTEAIQYGVPVLCSDLPALREAGGAVPDFLDPLDGPGWAAAITAYCQSGGPRAAQIERMSAWQRPRWDDHFATVAAVIDQVLT